MSSTKSYFPGEYINKDCQPNLWVAETCSTPLGQMDEFWQKRSPLRSYTKCVFMTVSYIIAAWSLIGKHILDSSSAIAGRIWRNVTGGKSSSPQFLFIIIIISLFFLGGGGRPIFGDLSTLSSWSLVFYFYCNHAQTAGNFIFDYCRVSDDVIFGYMRLQITSLKLTWSSHFISLIGAIWHTGTCSMYCS